MSKIPHSRDNHTRACPGCGASFRIHPDRDCRCPWWCRSCLAAMKRAA